LVAGDPEWRTEARRLREGIPLDPDFWKKLRELSRGREADGGEISTSR